MIRDGLAVLAAGGEHKEVTNETDAVALQRGRACFEVGTAALERADFAAAAAAFQEGLVHVPGRPSLLANLALAHWELGQAELATQSARAALLGAPGDMSACMTLAQCLLHVGDAGGALQACDDALMHHPQAALAWCNRGQALHALSLDAEAGAAFAQAVVLDPLLAVAWSNQGLLLGRTGQHAQALASLERALALDVELVATWVNLAEVRDRMGDINGALLASEQALLRDPQQPAARLNRAKLLADLGRSEEALAGFDALLQQQPGHAEARWNRALLLLELGDYARGWPEYEARWQLPDFEAARHAHLPQLPSLAAARGERVLVCCEQGLGDVIQFCRYVPELLRHAGTVVFEVPAQMIDLLDSLDPAIILLSLGSEGHPAAACRWRIPLLSLPALFGTTLDQLLASPAYLRAAPARISHWHAQLGPIQPHRPRIALTCSGNPRHPQDRYRSLPLRNFEGLARFADVILVQRDLAPADAECLNSGDIRWVGPAVKDFADTAAVLVLCDLVISVDTSILHLAGALGCRVWGLLAEPFDWRWLRHRDDSPWYPSMRLFRQRRPGDWPDVLARVEATLQCERLGKAGDASIDGTTGPLAADPLQHIALLLAAGKRALVAGDAVSARASLHHAQQLGADGAELHANLATALAQCGELAAALEAFQRAIELAPDQPEIHAGRGAARIAAGDLRGAQSDYYRVLALRPDDQVARRLLALIELTEHRLKPLTDQGRFDAALAVVERALRDDPQAGALHAYRGVTLSHLHRHDEALQAIDQAIGIEPAERSHVSNRAAIRLAAGDRAGARADYLTALAWRPGDTSLRMSLGMLDLAEGNFTAGWTGYESRLEEGQLRERLPVFESPSWDGQRDLAGRTLLLWAEQGLGDTLQFLACVPRVQALGAHVLLRLPASLKTLVSTLRGWPGAVPPQVFDDQQTLPPFDLHCSLVSLPHRLCLQLVDLPLAQGYVSADPQRRRDWQQNLCRRQRPQVGLVWSGNPRHLNDRNRSLPLARLLEALPAGIDYHVVQKDARKEDLAVLAAYPDIGRHAAALQDFADTAALLCALDGLVTVDTSVAHLAGALGVPFELLVPFRPDFRWMYDRQDSPWYPQARLHRQSVSGDWTAPLGSVAARLHALQTAWVGPRSS